MSIKAFFFSQKMFKSKVLFLSEKKYICQNQVISAKVMTPKIATNIYKTKLADITQNVWKSKKGGSVKADFLCGGVS